MKFDKREAGKIFVARTVERLCCRLRQRTLGCGTQQSILRLKRSAKAHVRRGFKCEG